MVKDNMTNREIIENMISKNSTDFDILKLAEECSELADVLITMVTKPNRREERTRHLIEELGDVRLRSEILIKRLGFEEGVKARYEDKLEYFANKMNTGKYDNY